MGTTRTGTSTRTRAAGTINNDGQSTLLKQYMDSLNKTTETKGGKPQPRPQLQATPNSGSSSSLTNPPSTLTETESFIRLSMNLPGVARASDIAVDVQRGVLLIRGTRSIQNTEANADTAPTTTTTTTTTTMEDDEETRRAVKKVKFFRRFAIDTDVV